MKFSIFNSFLRGLAVVTFVLLIWSCDDKDEPKIPGISTLEPTEIEQIKATCSGTITSNFELVGYKGICWSVNPNPTIEDDYKRTITTNSTFSILVENLTPGTTYYFCAFAEYNDTYVYGDVKSFITLEQTYVQDIEGNLYKTLTIGEQEWMIENLKVESYNNGDIIETTIPSDLNIFDEIFTENPPKYQWAYNGNENNIDEYGLLYTWYAVMDERNVCPDGWHIPSQGEWQELIDYVGGQSFAGYYLKEPGTEHWSYEDMGVKNTSGFTGIGGGRRHADGIWQELKLSGIWWSSTQEGVYSAITYSLSAPGSNSSYGPLTKSFGVSVRCIKD